MAGWNLADIFEVVAQEIPDSAALIQGSRAVTWKQLDRRANAIASYLTSRGIQRQQNVTQYLHNAPEYIESLLGCLKGAFVPFNTNYRYGAEELVYLWNAADAVGVVFHSSYAATVEKVRHRVPSVKVWLWVDDGGDTCPSWATPYESVAEGSDFVGKPRKWERSGDDLLLIYTGGTTGMPKGVMWRQDDLFMRLNTERGDAFPEVPDFDFIRSAVSKKGRPHLTAVPLMHGAGLLTCFLVLSRGGAISHLVKRSFDPADLLDTIQRDRVASLMWVGDAFARPTLATLESNPGHWNLSSLKTIMSSGVIFSAEIKRALLEHLPNVTISDVFGSSESMSLGRSVTTKGDPVNATGCFQAKSNTRVIAENGKDVVPGSGERGLLAIGGRQPLGYYKDAEKTARTFRMIDGQRYAVPGDWATLDGDGKVKLLGRGSECINTGGEKVFPEEVEIVLKTHADICDAVVIGIPDERFGQSVAAVVEPRKNIQLDPAAITAFVKESLAGYKAPRIIIFVESIGRGPNGKIDLKTIRERVLSSVRKDQMTS
jgi:3-oxocholest-4-en-26-oate---CoA ligase